MKSFNSCYKCSSSSSSRTGYDPQPFTKDQSNVCLNCLESSLLLQQTQDPPQAFFSDDETYFSGHSPQNTESLKTFCDYYDSDKPVYKFRGKIYKYPIKSTRKLHYNRIQKKKDLNCPSFKKGILFDIRESFRTLRKELDLQEEKVFAQASSFLMNKTPDFIETWTQDFHKALDNLSASTLPTFQNFNINRMSLELEKFVFISIEEHDGSLVLSNRFQHPSQKNNYYMVLQNWKKQTQRKLVLDFNNQGLNTDSINEMNQIFDEFDTLYELRINFSQATVTDNQILALCWNKINVTKHLQVLEINLEQCCLTDIGVSHVFQSIFENVKRLQSLEIRLAETKISDSSFKLLNTFIPKLWLSLVQFNMDLYSTKISDSAIQEFCQTLKNVALNLKKFALSLSQTQITDQSLIMLSNELISSMPLLQELELYLCNTKASDLGVGQLYTALQKFLPNLQALTLNLGHLELTEKSFEILSQHLLPELKCLQKLELFCYNTNIKDQDFTSIIKSLMMMQTIEIVELNFDSTLIADVSVELFTQYMLSKQFSLKSCNLSVNCCPFITKQMKNKFITL